MKNNTKYVLDLKTLEKELPEGTNIEYLQFSHGNSSGRTKLSIELSNGSKDLDLEYNVTGHPHETGNEDGALHNAIMAWRERIWEEFGEDK